MRCPRTLTFLVVALAVMLFAAHRPEHYGALDPREDPKAGDCDFIFKRTNEARETNAFAAKLTAILDEVEATGTLTPERRAAYLALAARPQPHIVLCLPGAELDESMARADLRACRKVADAYANLLDVSNRTFRVLPPFLVVAPPPPAPPSPPP